VLLKYIDPILAGSCVRPFNSNRRAPRALLARHLATGIRRLLDGINNVVQVDRGREGRLAAFAAADRLISDRLGEPRIHLTDVKGFT